MSGLTRRGFLTVAGTAALARGAGHRAFLATGRETYIADGAGRVVGQRVTGSTVGQLHEDRVAFPNVPGRRDVRGDGAGRVRADHLGQGLAEELLLAPP